METLKTKIDINLETCLKKLELINVLAFATIDSKENPRDRIISTIYVENNKIYFLTARGKDFYKELIESEKVSILGYSKYKEQIRVVGETHLVSKDKQDEYRNKILKKYPYLINVYPNKENGIETKKILDIFVIENAEVEYFNLGVYPIYRDYFAIGDYKITPKGFKISPEKCKMCGTCFRNCPQSSIIQGSAKDKIPYKINPNNCLHCGNCFEKCPFKAINRL